MRLDFCEHLQVSWCQWLNLGAAVLIFVVIILLMLVALASTDRE